MFEDRILKGIAWLDSVEPNWRDAVTGPIQQSHDYGNLLCEVFYLIGQAYDELGDEYVYRVFGVDNDWMVDHGFLVARSERAFWDALDAEWNALISTPARGAA